MAEATEIRVLIVLEARKLRSRCRQGWFLGRALWLADDYFFNCVLMWLVLCMRKERVQASSGVSSIKIAVPLD